MSMTLPCGLDARQAPVGWPGHSTAAGNHFCTSRVSGCRPVHRRVSMWAQEACPRSNKGWGRAGEQGAEHGWVQTEPSDSQGSLMKKTLSVEHRKLSSCATPRKASRMTGESRHLAMAQRQRNQDGQHPTEQSPLTPPAVPGPGRQTHGHINYTHSPEERGHFKSLEDTPSSGHNQRTGGPGILVGDKRLDTFFCCDHPAASRELTPEEESSSSG